jgi:hypothetical protein
MLISVLLTHCDTFRAPTSSESRYRTEPTLKPFSGNSRHWGSTLYTNIKTVKSRAMLPRAAPLEIRACLTGSHGY